MRSKRMEMKLFAFPTFLAIIFGYADSQEEVSCYVNGKFSAFSVNEKFLGLSLDPKLLIAIIDNISPTTVHLLKHLSPAFVRISGPSNHNVVFVEGRNAFGGAQDGATIPVTPTMWQSLNVWFKMANLTPVYAIDEHDRIGGVWDPRRTMPFFRISDRMNLSTYWQLGCGCTEKNASQYKKDLVVLDEAFKQFPSSKDWKAVGSNIDLYVPSNTESQDFLLQMRNNVDILTWRTDVTVLELDESKKFAKYLPLSSIPIWIISPAERNFLSFQSALNWAKQIGSAAQYGYDAIFRELQFEELLTDSPVYWTTLLHQTLMGRTVLDVAPITDTPNINIYAHCTRGLDDLATKGAITAFIVNNDTVPRTVSLEIVPVHSMHSRIHSYVLTSPDLSSKHIYLNDVLLEPRTDDDRLQFQPRIRTSSAQNHFVFNTAPKSINFFVLPGAKIPACAAKTSNSIRKGSIRGKRSALITSKAIEDVVALTARAQEAKGWRILDVQDGIMSRTDLDKLLKVNEVRTFAQMVDRNDSVLEQINDVESDKMDVVVVPLDTNVTDEERKALNLVDSAIKDKPTFYNYSVVIVKMDEVKPNITKLETNDTRPAIAGLDYRIIGGEKNDFVRELLSRAGRSVLNGRVVLPRRRSLKEQTVDWNRHKKMQKRLNAMNAVLGHAERRDNIKRRMLRQGSRSIRTPSKLFQLSSLARRAPSVSSEVVNENGILRRARPVRTKRNATNYLNNIYKGGIGIDPLVVNNIPSLNQPFPAGAFTTANGMNQMRNILSQVVQKPFADLMANMTRNWTKPLFTPTAGPTTSSSTTPTPSASTNDSSTAEQAEEQNEEDAGIFQRAYKSVAGAVGNICKKVTSYISNRCKSYIYRET